jgi:hypothetical protein
VLSWTDSQCEPLWYAKLGTYRLLGRVALSLDQRSDSQYPPFDVPYGKTADGQVFMRSVAVARISVRQPPGPARESSHVLPRSSACLGLARFHLDQLTCFSNTEFITNFNPLPCAYSRASHQSFKQVEQECRASPLSKTICPGTTSPCYPLHSSTPHRMNRAMPSPHQTRSTLVPA